MFVAAILSLQLLSAAPAGTAAPNDAQLEATYQQGVALLQGGKPAEALAAFDAVLKDLPATHLLFPAAVYGAGRAAADVGTGPTACRSQQLLSQYLGLDTSEPAKRKKVAKVLPEVTRRCEASTATIVPAPGVPASSAPSPPASAPPSDARRPLETAVTAEPPPPADASAGWNGTSPAHLGGDVALGGGVLAGALSAIYWNQAADANNRAGKRATARDHKRAVDDMTSANAVAVGLTSLGIALIGTGVGLLVFTE